MLNSTLNDGSELKSLTAQIRDAELQVLERQRMVIICADTLVQKAQQQITAPASLLLAGGIGFILSELTKSKPSESHSATEESRTIETADVTRHLMTTLNFLSSLNALYTTFRTSMRKTET